MRIPHIKRTNGTYFFYFLAIILYNFTNVATQASIYEYLHTRSQPNFLMVKICQFIKRKISVLSNFVSSYLFYMYKNVEKSLVNLGKGPYISQRHSIDMEVTRTNLYVNINSKVFTMMQT